MEIMEKRREMVRQSERVELSEWCCGIGPEAEAGVRTGGE